MKLKALIEILRGMAWIVGDNLDVEFWSYEWNDDLEDLDYHQRGFEKVALEDGVIKVFVTR